MAEFAGCLSAVRNNTAEVLCAINMPIKGWYDRMFKLCFFLLAETLISLKIFSISTHDWLNYFHDFT